jgi:hypothetical protein
LMARMPSAMSMMMMTTVTTGRRTLKLDRNMDQLPVFSERSVKV